MRKRAEYLSGDVCRPGRGCSFYKHMFFIDFERFNLTNPVYVNLVRDPVDRVASW